MGLSLIERAARIAAIAHKEQLRKGEDIPYIVHPFMIAILLTSYEFPEPVIAAALVHDVLEDTDFPEVQLRKEMGEEVMTILAAVTNDDSLSWEGKRKKYIETVRAGSDGVKAVATADKIHNAQSLLAGAAKQGPDVWHNFNAGREKKLWFENEMLSMLQETWRHPLVDEYAALVAEMNKLD
jgi:(p)ppGpp synthase/HD superfamily hydrolase